MDNQTNDSSSIATTSDIDYKNLEVMQIQKEMNLSMAKVNAGLNIVQSSLKTVVDLATVCKQTKYQMAVLDKQLDAYVVKCQTNMEKYRLIIPTIEESIRGISSRIDRITDAIIINPKIASSPEELAHQGMLLDLLKVPTHGSTI